MLFFHSTKSELKEESKLRNIMLFKKMINDYSNK